MLRHCMPRLGVVHVRLQCQDGHAGGIHSSVVVLLVQLEICCKDLDGEASGIFFACLEPPGHFQYPCAPFVYVRVYG